MLAGTGAAIDAMGGSFTVRHSGGHGGANQHRLTRLSVLIGAMRVDARLPVGHPVDTGR
jgi:hypothetical protein